MDTKSSLSADVQFLEDLLTQYANIPYAFGDMHGQTVFDREKNRFLLMTMGWDGAQRIHYVVVDIEIKDGKFWVHRDGLEEGIVVDLEQHGIPKDRIVLAWFPEETRKHTEYALK